MECTSTNGLGTTFDLAEGVGHMLRSPLLFLMAHCSIFFLRNFVSLSLPSEDVFSCPSGPCLEGSSVSPDLLAVDMEVMGSTQ